MTSASASGHTAFYCVHPAPPPTVNRLTSRQKAQLRRSNTKLTKVLGAAPQVVDELPLRVSHPLPLSASRKLQPSLSITSARATAHKRARSATADGRVDPELYPLSSTLRPASCDGHTRRSSDSQTRRHSYMLPPGLTSELVDEKGASFSIVYPSPRPRPQKEQENERQTRTTSISRDSLCDSLYEPTFSIPSATKVRREKMARVCKLLGEDVPVDLVFPVQDDGCANDDPADFVFDICAGRTPQLETPPPPPPKPMSERKPAVPPKPEPQPRWLTYRTPNLETIVEQSSRASCSSSSSSADSAFSLLSATTSSSYRFTSSSECFSASPPSSSAHETLLASAPHVVSDRSQGMSKTAGTYGRREFAIYVPFRRRTNRTSACQAEFAKDAKHECELVRGMLDLRV